MKFFKTPKITSSFSIRLLLCFCMCSSAQASDKNNDRTSFSKNDIEIGYLVNFARYIRWPKSAFLSDTSPITIAIDKSHPHAKGLKNTSAGKTKDGREILFVIYEDIHRVKNIHLLFINPYREKTFPLKKANFPLSTLTIGNSSDFLDQGGMIQFGVKDNNVVFYINAEIIKDSPLDIPYNVLRMARSFDKGVAK